MGDFRYGTIFKNNLPIIDFLKYNFKSILTDSWDAIFYFYQLFNVHTNVQCMDFLNI